MPLNFYDIQSQMKTGDILTFEGSAPLDYMINLLEDGKYSHVGMVLKDPGNGELYFWDAPGGGRLFPDPYKGQEKHKGTRVANLADLLGYYVTVEQPTFTWRQLESPAISAKQYAGLKTWIQANLGVPFPGEGAVIPPDIQAWFTAHFPNWNVNGEAELDTALGLLLTYLTGSILRLPVTESYFCAQLVAATYQQLALLPTTIPPNGYAPANFDDEPKPLTLNPGVKLGAPQPVILGPQVTQAR